MARESVEPPFVVATHARDVDTADRERFRERLAEVSAGRGLVVETCHRVEWYGSDPVRSAAVGWTAPAGARRIAGADAGRHALDVAVGLDSVVVGEDQVLHQLRAAVADARAAGSLDAGLDRLFAIALRAGRRGRSWRQAHRPSLADAAIARIEEHAGSVRGRAILVVGAGVMGALAAAGAAAAGARVTIANRTLDRADALARRVGGAPAPVDTLPVDPALAGVIVAIRGAWTPAPAVVDRLVASDAIVVDLSVPVAAAIDVRVKLGSRFVGVDDLARGPARLGEGLDPRLVVRLRALVDDGLAEFLAWREAQGRRDAARALAERAEREREAELAELWRRLPGLEPASRAAVERMARHLAERILREPLERLGDDRDGSRERAVRELWAL